MAFRDRLVDGRLLRRIVTDVTALLADSEHETSNVDSNELWDEHGTVPGGVNWSPDDGRDNDYLVVSGPEPEQPTNGTTI